MAGPYYVDSTATGGANTGGSWTDAFLTLAQAAAVDVAGDVVYVSSAHAEDINAGLNVFMAGTLASPNKIIGCDSSSGTPPTSSVSGGSCTTQNANPIVFIGNLSVHNLKFKAGSGGVSSTSIVQFSYNAGDYQKFVGCEFWLMNGTSSVPKITIGSPTSVNNIMSCEWENCHVKFNIAGHGLNMYRGKFRWNGGSILAGSVAITVLCQPVANTTNNDWELSGLDLSEGGAGMKLFAPQSNGIGRFVIRNCRLPASWTGSIGAVPTGMGYRMEMYNCDSADTNYRLWVRDYSGDTTSETTIIRTGGANDGTNGLSWKMASTANAEFPGIILRSPEIVQWNETTGSSKTATVEVVTDGVTLTDADCWLEIQYLGTSGYPQGSFADDSVMSDILATPTNQASSSETWTTTGLGSPVKQKLSVPFTPQEKGFIHAVVKLAKASTTVYVDPKLTVA